MNVIDFNKQFPNNETCLQYLFDKRFKNEKCPVCNKAGKYTRQRGTSQYVCSCGKHQLSPKAGTIFEKSRTDLYKWFFAIYLFSVSKNGVSAKELQRQLGVTYKCAWRMAKQIRSLFSDDITLGGTVEADETYIGGKAKNKRGRGAENKTPVFGMVERKGNVKAVVVPNVKSKTVLPILTNTVEKGTHMMTDEYRIYNRVQRLGFMHSRIQHGVKEYVRGIVHTNTIEGFWSQLKRSLDGTYHAVSPKYLQNYVDEFSWRYNHRSVKNLFDVLISGVYKPC